MSLRTGLSDHELSNEDTETYNKICFCYIKAVCEEIQTYISKIFDSEPLYDYISCLNPKSSDHSGFLYFNKRWP